MALSVNSTGRMAIVFSGQGDTLGNRDDWKQRKVFRENLWDCRCRARWHKWCRFGGQAIFPGPVLPAETWQHLAPWGRSFGSICISSLEWTLVFSRQKGTERGFPEAALWRVRNRTGGEDQERSREAGSGFLNSSPDRPPLEINHCEHSEAGFLTTRPEGVRTAITRSFK